MGPDGWSAALAVVYLSIVAWLLFQVVRAITA